MFERTHILVELENKRARRWDIIVQDLFLAHIRQVLDNRPERIAVGANQYSLTLHNLGANSVAPVWKDTFDSHFE